mgnify:CR=1 FL=1
MVYSVEMVLGKDSNLAIFVNNSAQGTHTAIEIFVRDLTGYSATLRYIEQAQPPSCSPRLLYITPVFEQLIVYREFLVVNHTYR